MSVDLIKSENVRIILTVTSHIGNAGEIISVSSSRGRDLIERELAEFFMDGGWPFKKPGE